MPHDERPPPVDPDLQRAGARSDETACVPLPRYSLFEITAREERLRARGDALTASHGTAHPETLDTLHEHAAVLALLGRSREADGLYRTVLYHRKKSGGEWPPEAMKTIAAAAELAIDMEGASASGASACDVWVWMDCQYGELDLRTLESRLAYAAEVEARGDWEAAEEAFADTLLCLEEIVGEDHPLRAVAMAGVARVHVRNSRPDEAEAFAVRAMEALRREVGALDMRTLMALDTLALAWQGQGRLDEAEAVLIRVADDMKLLMPAEHPRVLAAEERLAALYCSSGRMAAAAPLLRRIFEVRLERRNTDCARVVRP
jgi:tetratricopeptide (TPR) repeat protein